MFDFEHGAPVCLLFVLEFFCRVRVSGCVENSRRQNKNQKEPGCPAYILGALYRPIMIVGGCIAGGKRYLHINANGDTDPCVFIHYSNANIRQCSLLQALQSPIHKRGQGIEMRL